MRVSPPSDRGRLYRVERRELERSRRGRKRESERESRQCQRRDYFQPDETFKVFSSSFSFLSFYFFFFLGPTVEGKKIENNKDVNTVAVIKTKWIEDPPLG